MEIDRSLKPSFQLDLEVDLSKMSLFGEDLSRDDLSCTKPRHVGCDCQDFANASWKIDVSWPETENKPIVTLYCRRNSPIDTYIIRYEPYMRTNNTNPSGGWLMESIEDDASCELGEISRHSGNASFYGLALETSARIRLEIETKILLNIIALFPVKLHVSIYILKPSKSENDFRVKEYQDAFGLIKNTQLFSSSSPYPWDCVIQVEMKEVHVQKSLLSMHSVMFRNHFDKEDGSTFCLRNTDYDAFTDLLSVIYPTLCPITEENFAQIMRLAYRFQMPEVLKRCEVFLIAHRTKVLSPCELMALASLCDFVHLQHKCIEDCKDINDIKKLKEQSDYVLLNDQSKRMLLNRIVGAISLPQSLVLLDIKDGDNSTPLPENKTRAEEILQEIASSTHLTSDCFLLIENNRIPVHKSYLSFYSEFFNTMFESKFKEGREYEIVIEEVSYTDMLELLAVIYPTQALITALLKLSDRFIMPIIFERCKKELKQSATLKLVQKLLLAQQYNFTNFLEEFARELKSIEDVQKLKENPEYELLDDKSRALILDSIA